MGATRKESRLSLRALGMLSQSWWGSPSEQAFSSSSEPVDTVARQLPGGSGEDTN